MNPHDGYVLEEDEDGAPLPANKIVLLAVLEQHKQELEKQREHLRQQQYQHHKMVNHYTGLLNDNNSELSALEIVLAGAKKS